MLEVCIDSLESVQNAIKGGADELEICSSLVVGGLTPSSGLVVETMKLVNSVENSQISKPKVNIMIRCRAGYDFDYTEEEMRTMLADIEVYKTYGVDRFVFGALHHGNQIHKSNCARIIEKAHPVPLTFHRAFDTCIEPEQAIKDIIELGFTRLLTSGQEESADKGIDCLKSLLIDYGDKIEIMPGAGVNSENALKFIDIGFKIIHSSCKDELIIPAGRISGMDRDLRFVTNESKVKDVKRIIKKNITNVS